MKQNQGLSLAPSTCNVGKKINYILDVNMAILQMTTYMPKSSVNID
jgi:hypothetical protein